MELIWKLQSDLCGYNAHEILIHFIFISEILIELFESPILLYIPIEKNHMGSHLESLTGSYMRRKTGIRTGSHGTFEQGTYVGSHMGIHRGTY